jgi:arylsulfatase A-like enzyme
MIAPIVARCAENKAHGRTNIVLIVADDLGYGELGCFGGKDVPTPQIDSLADKGVRFTQAYVTAPTCAASRAALLTGRYQQRFGFEFNPIGAVNSDPAVGLPVGEITLAGALREAGYATALVGKWHLGGTAKFHPQRRCFDEFFGFLHEGHYFVPPPWDGHVTWLRRRTVPDGSQGHWTSPDARIVWSTHMGHFEPVTAGDSRPIRRTHYWRVGAQAAFIQDGWKIHRARGDKTTELYHLTEDPGEAHDLAAEHPERVAELEAAWRELDAGMVDPLWGGPIRKAF